MSDDPLTGMVVAGALARATVEAAFDRLRERRLEKPSPMCLPPGATIEGIVAELRGTQSESLEGVVVPIPVEARAAAKALRTAACWLPDEHRELLLDAASGAETHWDGACCPICQEVWCDDGCPLEEVRAEMMKEMS